VLVRFDAAVGLPDPRTFERYARRWIMRELSGWAQIAVLERLDDGSVEWQPRPLVPTESTARCPLGSSPLRSSPRWRQVEIRCVDRRGPRRPGLWAALAVGQALASMLGGTLVDPLGGDPDALAQLRPPADARVRVVDHLRITSTRGPWAYAGARSDSLGDLGSVDSTRAPNTTAPDTTDSGPPSTAFRRLAPARQSGVDQGHLRLLGPRRRLVTAGMQHFGLPDLELVDLPSGWVEVGARMILGVAQHLVDAGWSAPGLGSPPREGLVTSNELFWALGGDADTTLDSRGRGWTRVALEFDLEGAWPALLRLGPPMGARSWRSTGAWLGDAWTDLFGAPSAPAIKPEIKCRHSR